MEIAEPLVTAIRLRMADRDAPRSAESLAPRGRSYQLVEGRGDARRARHLTATSPVGHNAPMNGRSAEVIAEISRHVAPAFEADGRVRFAYVFGSVAREQDHPGSDLDLAVLTQPRGTLLDDARLQDALAAALGREDVDLLILNDAALWLRFRVVAGRVVFSRDERQRIAFREWVEKEFLDFRPYHESYLRAIRDRAQRGALSGG